MFHGNDARIKRTSQSDALDVHSAFLSAVTFAEFHKVQQASAQPRLGFAYELGIAIE
jgi:hypothetical protein